MNELGIIIGKLEEIGDFVFVDITTKQAPIWNADLNSLVKWEESKVIKDIP